MLQILAKTYTIAARLDDEKVAAPITQPGLVTGLINWIIALNAAAVERHKLTSMSDHQLKDLGLTRRDIQRELDKPVWETHPDLRSGR